jgi:hypothetical protein
MARTQFPEWRKQNEPTKYPFSDAATLTNAAGRLLTEGTFLDAALYPIGAAVGLYLTKAVVDFQTVTLYVGTQAAPELASGSFSLVEPPDQVALADAYGRPAGALVSEGRRLGLFQSWGTGTHEFDPADTEFAASCVFPTPEVGVRGVRLETGELFVGDVWLVGSDGVVFRATDAVVPVPGTCETRTVRQVRMDVVGDPLFRRRLCQPAELFVTPRFLKSVRVIGPNMDFTIPPDAAGNINITTVNDLAADTVLRIVNKDGGIEIGAVGSVTDS